MGNAGLRHQSSGQGGKKKNTHHIQKVLLSKPQQPWLATWRQPPGSQMTLPEMVGHANHHRAIQSLPALGARALSGSSHPLPSEMLPKAVAYAVASSGRAQDWTSGPVCLSFLSSGEILSHSLSLDAGVVRQAKSPPHQKKKKKKRASPRYHVIRALDLDAEVNFTHRRASCEKAARSTQNKTTDTGKDTRPVLSFSFLFSSFFLSSPFCPSPMQLLRTGVLRSALLAHLGQAKRKDAAALHTPHALAHRALHPPPPPPPPS